MGFNEPSDSLELNCSNCDPIRGSAFTPVIDERVLFYIASTRFPYLGSTPKNKDLG
jgi:hypothetical protein